ncbi:MAG: helix-turn-helix domain-containing protein [Candidatus Rokubacteria bacterium]|nr:helix-turn-helix domain-containing protein [Candidatus Rokubacteria bacterium]
MDSRSAAIAPPSGSGRTARWTIQRRCPQAPAPLGGKGRLFTITDLRVHHADLGVHVGPILVFSLDRNAHSTKELVQLRRQLELSQQQLAQWLNVSLVSVSRWERGRGHPSSREARTLARLSELAAAVGERLTPKEMARFFGEPHEDLYNDRPVDVLSNEIGYRAVRHLLERLLNAEYARRTQA